MYCFRVADAYLKGFLPIRAAVVPGNHDLEGEEFETDAANLAAWTKVGAVEQPCNYGLGFRARRSCVMQARLHGHGNGMFKDGVMASAVLASH